jgi:hypothetical protein
VRTLGKQINNALTNLPNSLIVCATISLAPHHQPCVLTPALTRRHPALSIEPAEVTVATPRELVRWLGVGGWW